MNLAVKMTISCILRDFKLGKHVESPYFNQLGILVRSSTENKIMSKNPPLKTSKFPKFVYRPKVLVRARHVFAYHGPFKAWSDIHIPLSTGGGF